MSDSLLRPVPPPEDVRALALRLHGQPTAAQVAAVRGDQLERWQRGDRVNLEVYLENLQNLRADEEALLDALYGEILVREALHDAPCVEEYEQRFPALAERLRRLLEVHHALHSGGAVTLDPACQNLVEAVQQHQSAFQALLSTQHVQAAETPAHAPIATTPAATAVPLSVGACPLAAGGEPVPGYCLVERLGKGGFGEVWKAAGPGGIEVALKFVPLGQRSGEIELQALQIVKNIRHVNLLALFGTWQVDGVLIIAMELADRTVHDRLEEVLRKQALAGIPRRELLKYAREAATVLDYLNKPRHFLGGKRPVGIQHCDVKPQNLLLLGDGVKVADFGLAQVLDKEETRYRGGLTPAYAPPEFFKGESSRHADQYALAVTYCQLRGGKLPFEGKTLNHFRDGHVNQIPNLTMLPEEEREAVAKALAKLPNERWPNCRAFVKALGEAKARERIEPVIDAQSVVPSIERRLKAESCLAVKPEVNLERIVAAKDLPDLVEGHKATIPPKSQPAWQNEDKPLFKRSVKSQREPIAWKSADPVVFESPKRRELPRLLIAATLLLGLGLTFGIYRLGTEPQESFPAAVTSSPPTNPQVLATQTEPPELLPPPKLSPEDLTSKEPPTRPGPDVGPLGRLRDVLATHPLGSAGLVGLVLLLLWHFRSRQHGERQQSTAVASELIPVDQEEQDQVQSALARHEPEPPRTEEDVALAPLPVDSSRPKQAPQTRRLLGHEDSIWGAGFAPDGRRVVSASMDKTIRLWDVRTGEEVRKIAGHTDGVTSVAFSPSGFRLLTGGLDNTVREWDAALGRELTCMHGHTGSVFGIAYAPDGYTALSCGEDRTLRLWDVDLGTELRRFEGHTDRVYAVAFAPDGRHALSGGEDETVRLWEVETGQEVRRFAGTTGAVRTVGFSPDGRFVVAGSTDGRLRLWNMDTTDEARCFEGHTDWVRSVAVSPDGTRLVSGSDDEKVRVWNVETGAELACFEGHAWSVLAVAFSPDGKLALSGSDDATLRFWDPNG